MKFQVQELRPEVLAFALLMEQRLREKDADKGQLWKNMTCGDLMVHTHSKCVELEKLVGLHYDAKIKASVDLANYAMMITDVAGALEQP